MGNRRTDDLGDDDVTADIDLVGPTAIAEASDPLDPLVSTSLSMDESTVALRVAPAAVALATTNRESAGLNRRGATPPAPKPPKAVPWAPVMARLQDAGVVSPDLNVEAEDATVIRAATSPRALMASQPSAMSGAVSPPSFASLASKSRPSTAVRPLGGATMQEPLPDTIGRYRILRRLNTGDASDVLLAQSAGPGGFSKWVVIKRVLPHLADDERAVDMFLREARIAARLNHSAIVQTYELGEDVSRGQRGYFIAMEYIEGLALTDIAQKTWSQGKSLPLELICSALGDVALGLQYAHELADDAGELYGLVHRDVCPDNVLVTKTGDAKLVDFGVATMANLTRFTHDGELRIKIPFTAPEQLKSEEIDGRADLYSLGVSLYWLSTATMPFTAKGAIELMQQVTGLVPKPPSAHNATLPRRFDDVVMKLMAKARSDRYASGEEVYEALLDAVPSSKNDIVALWADISSPFTVAHTDAGALPKPGVPAARLRRSLR